MTERPSVGPLLLAQVFDQLPARLRRRLEEEPELALAWTWRDAAVEAAPDAVVTLKSPVIASMADVRCTCLLAPKCLHIAAVLRVLHVDAGEPAPTDKPPAPDDASDEDVALEPKQHEAAEQMWSAGAAVLSGGASAAGLVVEGELLRAIHSCRVAGLHRLSAAGLRTIERIRSLRAERPEFRLEILASDMEELLLVARALSRERVAPEWVGTARREYRPAGSMKLAGIFSEPVIAATGYAGVVTYFMDSRRRIWSLADVAPGEAGRCQAAYRSAVAVGDVSLPHLVLCRRGFFLQRATASRDGRLGAGQSVGAVVSGPTEWNTEPLSDIFSVPIRDQLDSAWARADRAAGFDLLFIRGQIVGARENALLIETAEGVLRGFAPSDHDALGYRNNLRLLGSVPNLEVLAVGRIQFDHPASISMLAVAPAKAALPDEWLGRVNLGLDVLTRAHLPAGDPITPTGSLSAASPGAAEPLDAIRRRLLQVLMGGGATISPVAWSGIERDELMLTQCNLTTGAAMLGNLRRCGADDRPMVERLHRLSRAWLATTAYERGATAYVQRLAWLG